MASSNSILSFFFFFFFMMTLILCCSSSIADVSFSNAIHQPNHTHSQLQTAHEGFACNKNVMVVTEDDQLMQVSSAGAGPGRSGSPFDSIFIAVLLGIVAMYMIGFNISGIGIPLIFMFLLCSMGPGGLGSPIFVIILALGLILAFCGFNVSYLVFGLAIIAILCLGIGFGPSEP